MRAITSKRASYATEMWIASLNLSGWSWLSLLLFLPPSDFHFHKKGIHSRSSLSGELGSSLSSQPALGSPAQGHTSQVSVLCVHQAEPPLIPHGPGIYLNLLLRLGVSYPAEPSKHQWPWSMSSLWLWCAMTGRRTLQKMPVEFVTEWSFGNFLSLVSTEEERSNTECCNTESEV